jgi:hypothetical protein
MATLHQIRDVTPAEELEQMLRDLQAEVKALKEDAPDPARVGKLELTVGALTAAHDMGWDAGWNHRLQLVSAVS